MIITRTPFRVSFFGGGTDYPDWFRKHGGSVVATSIDKYCYLSVRHLPPFFEHKHRIVYSRIELPHAISDCQHPVVKAVLSESKTDKGFEIHHHGDLPARSGLGSSSAFTVGLLNAMAALDGRLVSKKALANEAIRIEQDVLKENVGCQDQVTTAYGGFNRIDFRTDGGIDVAPIVAPAKRVQELQDSLVLFFTGLSRYASEVAGDQIRNLRNREKELNAMQAMVGQAVSILQSENEPLRSFGKLLHENWQLKRELATTVTTPQIDEIYQAARDAGAVGGKLLGAGGGGFMLFYVPKDRQARVSERLSRLIPVSFRFETAGSRVLLYEPNGLENA
jgi:D-glycero-alpha-D-manno-heptose-7-phosphate kinase